MAQGYSISHWGPYALPGKSIERSMIYNTIQDLTSSAIYHRLIEVCYGDRDPDGEDWIRDKTVASAE